MVDRNHQITTKQDTHGEQEDEKIYRQTGKEIKTEQVNYCTKFSDKTKCVCTNLFIYYSD